MTLPIAISVPHAGLLVPEEAVPYCQLTREQIIKDSDEGAAEIYDLKDEVEEFITTHIARAIVDLNRPVDDRRSDGVVKTHTIWNEPIYHKPMPDEVISALIAKYYTPYHLHLSEFPNRPVHFAVDCHTMAAEAPLLSPKPGTARPEACLGNVNGQSFPPAWTKTIYDALLKSFSGFRVTMNRPFSGGHITKAHGQEMPWVQLELSRSRFLPHTELRSRILQALQETCHELERLNLV